MAHNYQKYWVFTWDADERDLLVDFHKLEELLNKITH